MQRVVEAARALLVEEADGNGSEFRTFARRLERALAALESTPVTEEEETMSMAIPVRPPIGGPRTCVKADGTPKSRYASLAVARQVARRYRSDGLHPYSCSTCGAVHLGHRP